MSSFRSDLLRTLDERGYIHQCTDAGALDALALIPGEVTAYVGYDCTASSLHVGHLVSIMMLRTLQRAGHQPIALVGGGTTKVGDPSFRDESRPLLDDAAIEANKAGIQRNLEAFLDFGPPTDNGAGAVLVDNAAWLDELRYIPFLRDFGTHFTINRMLTFDSVKLRLEREQPLTLLEFNYMVMQAYDFLELARRHDCRLQMGGSDQWGNIVNGVELGRRIDAVQLFGLTTPLITTASGAKMGKTAAGAVWLDAERLSPFDYWQYWRNTEDADVGRFLKLFTELPLAEITRLEALQGGEINEAKKVLAFEATTLAHGRAAAEAAAAAARVQFEGEGPAAIEGAGLPTIAIAAERLAAGLSVLELFQLAGLARSNAEVRRLIRGGGAKLDDERIDDEMLVVPGDRLTRGALKLSAGKKRHVLVKSS